jgi:hypothetical protein
MRNEDRRILGDCAVAADPAQAGRLGPKVAAEIAAPTASRIPTATEAQAPQEKCGWKHGDRGGRGEARAR